MDADHKLDMRESIAYPKRWTPKMNPPVPYQAYPKMPLIQHKDDKGALTGKADVPIYDQNRQPLIWANAREETEWLNANPKEAVLIAEANANKPQTLDNATHELAASKDSNKRLKAERDELDRKANQALDELAAAKAELAAMRQAKAGKEVKEDLAKSDMDDDSPHKLDMRTKAGRAAAKLAAEG
jgi:hypothetical protein